MNTQSQQQTGQSDLLADYWTLEELAAKLGKTTRSLSRWHAARVGPPRTALGQNVLYRKDAVRAWLIAQEDENLRGKS